MNLNYIKASIILTLAILIAGCGASKQQAMLDTIHSPKARPASFAALEEDFNRAEKDDVNLISPDSFSSAKKSFDAAKRAKLEGQAEEKYVGDLNQARSDLDSAMSFSKENRARMGPLMDARKVALSSGAEDTTNKDLKALEKKYLVLVANLSKSNSREDALEQIPELTSSYRQLTIKTVQNKYLGEARNNLELAKKENAKDLVPKTWKETEAAIKRAQDYISQDQKATALPMVSELSSSASLASRRLLVLTRQAKISKDLSPEEISLKTESLLNSVGESLAGKDLRDLSFEAHAAALSDALAVLKKDQTVASEESVSLRNSLTGSQEKISELETKTSKYSQLEQKDEKNKKFESVRELFDEAEAKVYRQGDSLVISLKKINFPVNQSEIPNSSFGLLKKVQSAIRTFEQPSVVVEGHTDSSGEVASNKLLSEKRAEAVKAYLLSNNVLSQEKIESIGYGSEKPLASNKLASGRAINRRIDIVIKD